MDNEIQIAYIESEIRDRLNLPGFEIRTTGKNQYVMVNGGERVHVLRMKYLEVYGFYIGIKFMQKLNEGNPIAMGKFEKLPEDSSTGDSEI